MYFVQGRGCLLFTSPLYTPLVNRIPTVSGPTGRGEGGGGGERVKGEIFTPVGRKMLFHARISLENAMLKPGLLQ